MSNAPHSCIFCKIVRSELPASIVYENDEVLAIMDIQPINTGHLLVIPKTHYQFLHQVPHELGQKLFAAVQTLEKALWQVEGLRCEGTNILQNNGRSAWQEVPHAHFHIIPRFADDKFKIRFQAGKPDRADLDQLAARIVQAL
jgi:histidine triad (HIT) family protein